MSNELTQQPFFTPELAENVEPRCACLLLLDNSGSMAGERIRQLNDGLKVFETEIKADSLTSKRVEIAIVSFGPVQIQQEFVGAQQFFAPELAASSDTPMGAAIEKGLEMLRIRKDQYKAGGVQYYRPWVFLITDGAPTDNVSNAGALIREGESSKSFSFYSVAVEGADMVRLKNLNAAREPLKLKGLSFAELFQWLSSSLGAISRSNPGEQVPVDNPTAPNGWAVAG